MELFFNIRFVWMILGNSARCFLSQIKPTDIFVVLYTYEEVDTGLIPLLH